MKPLQAICYYHSCINLVITSQTLALALSGAEVLYIFQSRCLIAGLQEKTTYRLALFLFGGSGARNALQKKTTKRARSKVMRETASYTRQDVTLETSTSAFTRSLLYGRGPPFLCVGGLSFLYGENGRKSKHNSR